jgi:colanic acid/amylovoran biosynthesis protein
VEALLVTTIEQVRLRDPAAEFTVLTGDASYDAHRCSGNGVKVMDPSLPQFSPTGFGLKGLVRLFLRRRGERWRRLVTVLREADLVIASGGDMFSSEYGRESLDLNLAVLRLAAVSGRPVVFLGHSIGPFRATDELAAWARVAAQSPLITLREGLSYDYVRANSSLPQTKVAKTADVAFLLRPSETGEKLFEALGLDPRRPTVACAISQGISRYAGVDSASHMRAWHECIEHFAVGLGLQVLLIPHVQDRYPGNDDAILGTGLLRRVSAGARVRTRLAAGDFSAAEYKALISRCELVIAERMHAAIAGLSSGVATLAVGYSVKARGILLDILGPQMVEDGLLMPVESFAGTSNVVQRVERVFGDRHRIAAELRQRLPRVQEAARANFELLHEVAAPRL